LAGKVHSVPETKEEEKEFFRVNMGRNQESTGGSKEKQG